jgi:lipoprotein-releasing system ATP-binding protein
MADANILLLQNIDKSFVSGNEKIQILKNASLSIKAKERVALIGPSGSGKTTLLQIAGLLDIPDAGSVHLVGSEATKADDKNRTALRRNHLGFVYQFHHLLPEFSALENVMMPGLIAGVPRKELESRARELLANLGLSARLTHRPHALSGGEQQRVAIARALVESPDLILADEPTGNLDPKTAEYICDHLLALTAEKQSSLFIVTHNLALAARMDRIVTLSDGKIIPYEAL